MRMSDVERQYKPSPPGKMLVSPLLIALLVLGVTAFVLATVELLDVLPPRRKRTKSGHAERTGGKKERHILIILGSGGHTAEMLLMLDDVGVERFGRRTWAFSRGDGFSAGRAGEFEGQVRSRLDYRGEEGKVEILEIPRAREIHQSLLTTPLSSLNCLWTCLRLLVRLGTVDLILTNGPGTGVVMVFASITLRFLASLGLGGKGLQGQIDTRVVYVESLARIKNLSLSGRILKRVVDRFCVQWERLEGEFLGPVVLEAARKAGIPIAMSQDPMEVDGRVTVKI